jgi:hypothetical protein
MDGAVLTPGSESDDMTENIWHSKTGDHLLVDQISQKIKSASIHHQGFKETRDLLAEM